MQKIIVVNATALTSGGALTILRDFISNIDDDINNKYYIFINKNIIHHINIEKSNIKLITTNIHTVINRIYWDFYGLKKYLKKHKIIPNTIISLQNTSINFEYKKYHTKQIIYLHQGIPLSDKSWSFFKKDEIKLAFYKYIYPFFIFRFYNHKYTTFIVQTNWMKQALNKTFKINLDNIKVIKPNLSHIISINTNINQINKLNLTHKFVLFYPTSAVKFKNYTEIAYAINYIKNNKKYYDLGLDINNIALYITIDKTSDLKFYNLIKKLDLEDNIIFLGHLNYDKVLEYYNSMTALVFPSYIESLGLPLIEATIFNKPIIAINQNYSKEVLSEYTNKILADGNNHKQWAEAISKIILR